MKWYLVTVFLLSHAGGFAMDTHNEDDRDVQPYHVIDDQGIKDDLTAFINEEDDDQHYVVYIKREKMKTIGSEEVPQDQQAVKQTK